MRSPEPAPVTAAASNACHKDALAALRCAGVRCEYAPEYEGALQLSGHVVPHNKLVLWLDEGPRLYLRMGQRSWDHRPRKGLLDFLPQGDIDTVRAEPGRMRALLIYVEGGWSEEPDFRPSSTPSSADLQFADVRLRRIATALERVVAIAHLHGPIYTGFLAHALIARLQERLWPGHDRSTQAHELSPASRRIITDYMSHALGARLTIDEMAALIGYRPPQFMRAFHATFGVPPHRYLLHQRLSRARELLRASNLALTDIALQLGFASHSHFSTAFRSETGLRPSDYRRTMGQTRL